MYRGCSCSWCLVFLSFMELQDLGGSEGFEMGMTTWKGGKGGLHNSVNA